MTIDELESLIETCDWFARLGEPDFDSVRNVVALKNFSDWKDVTGILPNEPISNLIKQGMKWLPTQRDMEDPIHGKSLEKRAEQAGVGQESAERVKSVYMATLVSLRRFQGQSSLKVGAHDFTEAAKGDALFATRRAALESLLGEHDFWCRVMNYYKAGHWPCGTIPDGRIVVF